jgi:hypothetical protein
MKFNKKYLLVGLITFAGLGAGFLYWRFIGCSGGSCPITSHWYSSAFVGALLGYFTGDSINDLVNKKQDSQK